MRKGSPAFLLVIFYGLFFVPNIHAEEGFKLEKTVQFTGDVIYPGSLKVALECESASWSLFRNKRFIFLYDHDRYCRSSGECTKGDGSLYGQFCKDQLDREFISPWTSSLIGFFHCGASEETEDFIFQKIKGKRTLRINRDELTLTDLSSESATWECKLAENPNETAYRIASESKRLVKKRAVPEKKNKI